MATTFALIKDSFADYLTKPYWNWSWYATQTFDPEKFGAYPRLHEHSWRYFLNQISKTAAISYGFCFAEAHKSGKMHWHALVHVTENLLGQPRRKDIWQKMFWKYGYNQILPFAHTELQERANCISTGIARYLTKYVAKEAARDQAWWDFNGNISGKDASAIEIRDAIGAPMSGELLALER